ncbi:MAG: hypothetical protein WBV93_06945, partial [Anaerobacillus sp.]
MSEKKRKPQVIRVDKLIVKANEVIIHDEREHHHKKEEQKEERKEERRDPWGFFGATNRSETRNQ